MVLKSVFSEKMCGFIHFFYKNRDFFYIFWVIFRRFHPLGSIRCQRCREVDLEGHWVQLRAHLIGFNRNATIYFFQDFFEKKHVFQSFFL